MQHAAQHCWGMRTSGRPPRRPWKKGAHVDRRQWWIDLDNAAYVRDQLKIPDCQILLRVDRDVTREDGTLILQDTRYFVSSLDPSHITAQELLASVPHHWQTENGVYFLQERWWDGDRHGTKRPGLFEWLAKLTTAATMVLRIFRNNDEPLRAHADAIQWRPSLALRILGAK